MKCYLVYSTDSIDEAIGYRSKAEAIEAYRETALNLLRFDQRIEATIHIADNPLLIAEYPDFALSIGPRNGVKVDRC